jgi:hypothetical protein
MDTPVALDHEGFFLQQVFEFIRVKRPAEIKTLGLIAAAPL